MNAFIPGCLLVVIIAILGPSTPVYGADPGIDGYAGAVSYAPGDELTLHVSTSEPVFSVEIFRVGAERSSVWSNKSVTGILHPVPGNASSHGCGWPTTLTLDLPAGWISGYYEIVLRADESSCQRVNNTR